MFCDNTGLLPLISQWTFFPCLQETRSTSPDCIYAFFLPADDPQEPSILDAGGELSPQPLHLVRSFWLQNANIFGNLEDIQDLTTLYSQAVHTHTRSRFNIRPLLAVGGRALSPNAATACFVASRPTDAQEEDVVRSVGIACITR